jgi:hypothetical protein
MEAKNKPEVTVEAVLLRKQPDGSFVEIPLGVISKGVSK